MRNFIKILIIKITETVKKAKYKYKKTVRKKALQKKRKNERFSGFKVENIQDSLFVSIFILAIYKLTYRLYYEENPYFFLIS